MLCRVLRTKQAKHVRRSAPIFTSIILDAQEKGAALRFLQASSWMRRKNRPSAREQTSLPRPVAAKARRCLRQKQPSWSRGRGLNFQAHCMRAGNSGYRNPDETGKACQAQRSDFYKHHPGCAGKIGQAQESGLLCRVLWLRSRAASCGRSRRGTTKARRVLRTIQPSWSWGSCPNLRARCDARWKFG